MVHSVGNPSGLPRPGERVLHAYFLPLSHFKKKNERRVVRSVETFYGYSLGLDVRPPLRNFIRNSHRIETMLNIKCVP